MYRSIKQNPVGERFGEREVVEVASLTMVGTPQTVIAVCSCGRRDEVRYDRLRGGDMQRCTDCAKKLSGQRRHAQARERWEGMVGKRIGRRTVLKYIESKGRHVLLMQCECGRTHRVSAWAVTRTNACSACLLEREPGTVEPPPMADPVLVESSREGALIWRIDCKACGPGERCGQCEARLGAVSEFAGLMGPMPLEAIGTLIGVSRERARQIVRGALAKLKQDGVLEESWEMAEERLAERDGGSWTAWSGTAEVAAGEIAG